MELIMQKNLHAAQNFFNKPNLKLTIFYLI